MKFVIIFVVTVLAFSTASIPLREKEIIDPIPCSNGDHSIPNWECEDPTGWALVKNMETKGQQLEEVVIKMLQPPEPPKNVTQTIPQNVTEIPPQPKEKSNKGFLTNILDTVKKFFK